MSGKGIFLLSIWGLALLGFLRLLLLYGRGSEFRAELIRQYGPRKGWLMILGFLMLLIFTWWMIGSFESPLNQ